MTAGASSQGTNPEPRPPRPPAGSEAAHGAQESHLEGDGLRASSGPTLFPRSRGGEQPPSPTLAPPLPTSSSAPLLLFPKSTPLIHDFPPQSWAPLYNPSPVTSSSRSTSLYQVMGRFPGFLDQTLTSLSSLATSLALLPEKPQVSRLQV